MKQVYEAPEMEIRWFESESICNISNADDGPDHIPEHNGGSDNLGWN